MTTNSRSGTSSKKSLISLGQEKRGDFNFFMLNLSAGEMMGVVVGQISIEVILHISVRLLHLQCGSTACLGDSPERSQCHDVSPHCHNWTDCLLLYHWVCVCVCVCLSLSLSHSAVTLTMAKKILGVCCPAVVARLAMKICAQKVLLHCSQN